MENIGLKTELKRDLGAWPAASIVVGTVIGSGIFLVPRTMIQRVGSVEMVFVVWIAGGLLSLAGALSYAELAAAMPEATPISDWQPPSAAARVALCLHK